MRFFRDTAALAVAGALLATALATVPGAGAAPSAPSAAATCKGFKNQTGITSTTVRVGNASDLTGPVPSLYSSAQVAVAAYIAYFNSVATICGRKLALDRYDTATDANADLAATKSMCTKDFASVGSLAVFDSGGATSAQACGLPDLRVTSFSTTRNSCTTCFGVQASRLGEAPNAAFDGFVRDDAMAASKAAILYLNAGSGPARAAVLAGVAQQRGFHYLYNAPIDVADLNYGPYVAQLKARGVQLVQFVGGVQQTIRLAKAMQAADYQPKYLVTDATSYVSAFTPQGGAAVDGTIAVLDFLPLATQQTELNRYRAWLKKIAPTAVPTAAGLYAWSAMKLFTQQAKSLASGLSRATLVARLRNTTGWTGGGMHAPMQVGTKHVSGCVRMVRVVGGHWRDFGAVPYFCNGVTSVAPPG